MNTKDKKIDEKNKKTEELVVKKVSKKKAKQKKNISSGIAFVNSTFNNTIISIADTNGNVPLIDQLQLHCIRIQYNTITIAIATTMQ